MERVPTDFREFAGRFRDEKRPDEAAGQGRPDAASLLDGPVRPRTTIRARPRADDIGSQDPERSVFDFKESPCGSLRGR